MLRTLCCAAAAAVVAISPLAAQASRYVPLDHPLLPAIEHLISRGEIEDPSPNVRPFRQRDLIQALDSGLARGTLADGRLAARLREAFTEEGGARPRWGLELRAGGQGYTHARRDPLHPEGPGGVRPYVEARAHAVFGNVLLVTRPAIEPRLTRDPDWPGRRDLEVTGRHLEGYLSAQFRWVRLFFGQMDQNWGPAGVPGIGLSDYGYPRVSLGLEVGSERLRLAAQASLLRDARDSTGARIHRYFFAHRLAARLTDRLHVALWETTVLAGADREFDWRFGNPVTILLLANQYGLGDEGNVLVGLDATWQFAGRTSLALQLGIDDIQYQNRSGPTRTPDRYAFTVAAFGPLGRQLAWRGLYTQATSLAFRTANPFESFTDAGVGLGRGFADNEQATLQVSAPVLGDWLVTPEFALLRQGEGRITDPFPPAGVARGDTPRLFIGVRETTWRWALGVSGRAGPLDLAATGGLHRVHNADHVRGRDRTRFEGRIQATLGLAWSGELR
ncbi:MAG TPA: hypothetical protein VNJ71_11660 [Gemmatimonadales bacterium]|jgi:hypothetical protein|nr:hypothetical protein [Gemmatimonadales bacterium]